MRKKILSVSIAMIMAVTMLAGCGPVNVPGETDTVDEGNVTVTEATEEDTEVTEAEMNMLNINISDWSYPEKVDYISDDYMVTKQGELYYIIDKEGNVLSDDRFLEGLSNGFDSVTLNQQGGTFIVKKTTDDGFFVSAVMNGDMNSLYKMGVKSPAIFYITDYRDDLVFGEQYKISEDGSIDKDTLIRACGAPTNDECVFSKTQFIKNDGLTFNTSYGTIIAKFAKYDDKRECFCFTKPADLEKSQLISGENVTYTGDEISIPYVDSCPISFNDNLPNKEGWISASMLSGEREENGDGTWNMSAIKQGFYNVKTGEYVENPEDVLWTKYFTEDNGCSKCTALGSRALGAVEKISDDLSYYKIIDLKTGEFASDKKYISAAIAYHDLLLVENTDEKWGYIRNDDLTETGEWYDDATDFCNGYAVVIRDGKGWIIDEELNKVSDEFDAESAYSVTDYIVDSNLNGSSVFFIQQDGEYHMLTVEK